MANQQARFWVYENDAPVLIKIGAGQSLAWRECHATDEGFSSQSVTWNFDGDGIFREWQTDGRDCDGRLTRFGTDYCPVTALRSGPEMDGVVYPAWQDSVTEQRDEYAEMAGY